MWQSYRALAGLCALTLVALVIMTVVLCLPQRQIQGAFVPPVFDSAAVSGTPDVPDGLGYRMLSQEGMAYRVGICGKIEVESGEATVFLTNPSDNALWLKVRLYDKGGNTVGESGLIRPGEYLRAVTLFTSGKIDGMTVKIMSYEPDTYRSLGAVTVTPAVVYTDLQT